MYHDVLLARSALGDGAQLDTDFAHRPLQKDIRPRDVLLGKESVSVDK